MAVTPTDRRAASTVLDVCLCCLLVGAAAAVLTAVPAPEDHREADGADEAATALGRTTATVEYEVCAGDGEGCLERRERGTLAGLLARAAVANATVDGRTLDPTRQGFVAAVRERTGRELAPLAPDAEVGVTAVWEPYAGAPLSGRVRAGPTPPATADVHAATLSVPSGTSVSSRALRRADDQRDVAEAIAWALVADRYPPAQASAAFRAAGVTGEVAAARYRGAADALGVSLPDDPVTGDRITPDPWLVSQLADRLTPDLRERFDTSRAAAEAVAVGRVRIVVRTWSA